MKSRVEGQELKGGKGRAGGGIGQKGHNKKKGNKEKKKKKKKESKEESANASVFDQTSHLSIITARGFCFSIASPRVAFNSLASFASNRARTSNAATEAPALPCHCTRCSKPGQARVACICVVGHPPPPVPGREHRMLSRNFYADHVPPFYNSALPHKKGHKSKRGKKLVERHSDPLTAAEKPQGLLQCAPHPLRGDIPTGIQPLHILRVITFLQT